MVTQRLQQVIDAVAHLPPEEQDRLATVIQSLLQQPILTSDVVRPDVMAAFEDMLARSTAVLDYLRDK